MASVTHGDACFDNRARAILSILVVVTRRTVADGGKCRQCAAYLIISVDTRLQRIEPFGPTIRLVLECLYMEEAHVTADSPAW